jgi:hypothetical protein
MGDNLKFLVVAVITVGGVLAIGWNQPLSYRFMSPAEIYALENPTTPPPPPAPPPLSTPSGAWMWDPQRRTPLDTDAYNRASSVGPNYYYNRRYITPYPTR